MDDNTNTAPLGNDAGATPPEGATPEAAPEATPEAPAEGGEQATPAA